MNQDFTDIQLQIQNIIDLISEKKSADAALKLAKVHDKLDDLIDFSEEGDDLMELSRFQVLLNHLQQKIEVLKIEMN